METLYDSGFMIVEKPVWLDCSPVLEGFKQFLKSTGYDNKELIYSINRQSSDDSFNKINNNFLSIAQSFVKSILNEIILHQKPDLLSKIMDSSDDWELSFLHLKDGDIYANDHGTPRYFMVHLYGSPVKIVHGGIYAEVDNPSKNPIVYGNIFTDNSNKHLAVSGGYGNRSGEDAYFLFINIKMPK